MNIWAMLCKMSHDATWKYMKQKRTLQKKVWTEPGQFTDNGIYSPENVHRIAENSFVSDNTGTAEYEYG